VLDLFRVDGRRALVTGGSKGLGRVIAQALAEAGADVAVVSRTRAECETAAHEIGQATGRKMAAFAADVTRSDEIERMATEAESALGGPMDILVNNAGVNVRGPAHELAEADWDAVIDINLKAPFLCARRFGPGMCARGWGRVLNLGSILSVIGIPGRAPYASAKAGLLNLTRVLALEWAASGVTVNALCPGPFATDMNKPLLEDPEKYRAFVAKIPQGRWGELHEIAGPALFLCSDAASFVTGSALFVDGGWTAQ
jgi:NAD(P)-dependent dehydrogenase (short-subunit alcohol dehydrogenase family)